MRRFVKGDAGVLGEFATRLTGSADLYEHSGRRPFASINFVTCHDGFTLADLVSYNEKHNEANGEENRDGESHNNSWNCGAEGDTDSLEIKALRAQQKRNLLALLMFSIGVPMLSGGDELGRSQKGNNNAYCQDNDISWYNWNLNDEDKQFLEFVRKIICIRKSQVAIQRKQFFRGTIKEGGVVHNDIAWFGPRGKAMTEVDWTGSENRCVGALLEGRVLNEEPDLALEEEKAKTVFLIANSAHVPVPFKLPPYDYLKDWIVILDTSNPERAEEKWKVGTVIPPRCIMLLERR